MNQSAIVLGASLAAALAAFGERSAAACGGCFHPPTQTASDITDERMLLSVSTTQTTLYDQIRYAGQPSSFAWVLPIHGTVTVGLSADVLFNSVDLLTATQITPPPSTCAPCGFGPAGGSGGSGGQAATLGGGGNASSAGIVTVTHEENVGPYATVQLHSTDGAALNTWLTQNGFNIPADVQPVIAQYVTEGFDFLAMKLLPNAGVRAMRPVRVTSAGASLSLPLRMAAIGTGAIVGITIWVVSDGRYEPQNFPLYHIEDKDLVWDFSTNLSNYTTLRVQNEANLQNGGWEIESSLTLNQQLVTSVVLGGGRYYGGFGGFRGAAPPSDPTVDYLPVPAADAGPNTVGGQTAEEVRTADLAALFAGVAAPNARFTRMRGDIAHAAMKNDLLVQASADQSELPNTRALTRGVNEVCACGHLDGGPSASRQASSGSSSGQASSGSPSGQGVSSSSGAVVDASVSSPQDGAVSPSGSSSSQTASASSSGQDASGSSSGHATPETHGTDGGGGFHCSATSASSAGSTGGLGAIAAFVGLAFARAGRARRRS